MEEIEIPELPPKGNEKGMEEKGASKQPQSVPLRTLFMRFSNSKERVSLIVGFLCWVLGARGS